MCESLLIVSHITSLSHVPVTQRHVKLPSVAKTVVVVEMVKETSKCIGNNLVLNANIRNRKNHVKNRKD